MSRMLARNDGMNPGHDPLADFLPQVSAWFRASLGEPTPPQVEAWPLIRAGANTLVTAPTGSGKTLAAFLAAIDRLLAEERGVGAGVDVVYVSPLKALNADIDRNLQRPIDGIARLDDNLASIGVAVRSGDTPSSQRQKMNRYPPDILITTPESLYLMLTARRSRPMFRSVRTVIVDEIHAIYGSKRGTHLALSLERLSKIAEVDPQRIGLSATVNPVGDVARFLGGSNRQVEIVEAASQREMSLAVVGAHFSDGESVWDEVVANLVRDVRSHKSTLIFVNNRSSAEKLVGRLNDAVAAEHVETDGSSETDGGSVATDGGSAEMADAFARAHHGSVSHDVRARLEEDLKSGNLRCLVATGTLELGIDMGAIDLVCQVESPKSVARGLQRVGRSGHLVGERSAGRIYPLYRTDVVEAAALAEAMFAGDIEAVSAPRNCLDVLAQQIVAEVAANDCDVDALYSLVRRAAPYRDLSRNSYDAVVSMLAGETRDPDLVTSKPRIVWDRSTSTLRTRPGSGQLAATSGGTIPDRGLFPVRLAGADIRLGELDEEFVFESKPGDVFALGSSLWRIAEIGRDRVIVTAAPGSVPRMPFWRGEGLGRPVSLGRSLGRMLADVESGLNSKAALRERLRSKSRLDEVAADALIALVDQQATECAVPTDTKIVVEAFNDEVGDWRIVVHSIFGRRVNMGWSMALRARIRDRLGFDVESVHSDDGIVLRFPGLADAPSAAILDLVTAPRVDDIVIGELAGSSLFASRFRENSQRALLLPRNRPGTRTPLWLQRLRAADLMAVAERDADFPVIVETYRECLEDVLDLPTLRDILSRIARNEIEVRVENTSVPSPFAAAMLWRFAFDYIYQSDAPKVERRAVAVTMNRELLVELLGSSAMRDVLDAGAVADVTGQHCRTADGWRARNPEELLDLVRRAGDLTTAEIDQRYVGDAAEALAELAGQVATVAGRSVVADQAGEFELVMSGSTSNAAIQAWLRRSALSRGIFGADELSDRYGLTRSAVVDVLAALADSGILVRGEFAPGGRGEEWVGADLLSRMHRRTLSMLRARSRPVDEATYTRFLARRHYLDDRMSRPSGADGVDAVLDGLEGAPLHAEVVESEILARRVDGYRPEVLDGVLASGEWVWLAVGGRRITFVRPDSIHLVDRRHRDPAEPIDGVERLDEDIAVDCGVFEFLKRGGGWRASELSEATELGEATVRRSLDRLVWASLVTNDSFLPLRRPDSTSTREPSVSRRLSRRRRARPSGRHGVPPFLRRESRWSAISDREDTQSDAHFVAEILLSRYGIVAREMWAAERWAPPWTAVRAAFDRMEATGDVRRGYFVSGLSGVQFARSEVVDEIRDLSDDETNTQLVVAATDPANPYGPLFESHGVRRASGAHVVLEGGAPVLTQHGNRVMPLSDRPAAAYEVSLSMLNRWLATRVGRAARIQVDAWGSSSVLESPMVQTFKDAGWRQTPRGFAPGSP